ncbi:hypothetical protein SELMODRAFT_414490 [Selaginella moellendorffii]|uniref:Uncharacterized protein n=1 Tax=Selaginella moellendorffii TaxID=88036 RepID=D8RSY2_SELML|nr:hypothetical protein SELMODRAFT_414490 [Selaginella moellendorffii]
MPSLKDVAGAPLSDQTLTNASKSRSKKALDKFGKKLKVENTGGKRFFKEKIDKIRQKQLDAIDHSSNSIVSSNCTSTTNSCLERMMMLLGHHWFCRSSKWTRHDCQSRPGVLLVDKTITMIVRLEVVEATKVNFNNEIFAKVKKGVHIVKVFPAFQADLDMLTS